MRRRRTDLMFRAMVTSNDLSGSTASRPPGESVPSPPDDRARDPVCGMAVRRETAKWTTQHDGQAYFFCNERCLTRFREDPSKYLGPKPAPAPAPEVPV